MLNLFNIYEFRIETRFNFVDVGSIYSVERRCQSPSVLNTNLSIMRSRMLLPRSLRR